MTEVDTSAFERALTAEIAASELLRMRIVALVLVAVLVANTVAFALQPAALMALVERPLEWWVPVRVIGPFLAYECLALALLHYRQRRGRGVPPFARIANTVIETSLPTYILWWTTAYAEPANAFNAWLFLLYFVFIVASTLRLNFVLPVITGVVAAAGYLGLFVAIVPVADRVETPVLSLLFHAQKAGVMVVAGIVAGLVAVRLRGKFARAAEEAAARERVTNLFGQHVSPAVVDRLLDSPAEFDGETREVCVMFLDIRDFTAFARTQPPEDVVDVLNRAFAFMIEAIDRHHGIVNKFLGDGFMAVFGAPLPDPDAVPHAVAAARDILAELDRRAGRDGWRLRIGIGLHAGPAVTGTIGSPRRKEFTVIGDTVNLASRLEQLNKEFGSRLLVSDAVKAALGPTADGAASLGAVVVKGYSEPVPVWRLD